MSWVLAGAFLSLLIFGLMTLFFDQAVIVRRGTVYEVSTTDKVVALTFDDGPSGQWTPQVLDALKASGVKATFFVTGEHVEQEPDIARRIVREGHELGNHTYDHHLLLHASMEQFEEEITHAAGVIEKITGVQTFLFRPPKAWLTDQEKKRIGEMGYKVVLWTLNSKDWVTFDDKYIVSYLIKRVAPGDIILFHDGGGAFSTEGGNREETVKSISRLVEKLRAKGYRCVTVSELIALGANSKR